MIKVGIIGTGNIAPSHIDAYLAFPDLCEIVALADIYPFKAENIKKKYNLNAEIYEESTSLLKRGDLQLISVCTPPFTHAEISIQAMEAGCDVICEKPMAASLEECDAMMEAQNKTGKRLSIISQNRFQTPIMKLKKMLDAKVAGRVLHAAVDSFWWRGHSYYDLWWRGTWEKEGGGCTLNHAVHHIDILCWMMGLPTEITAVLANLDHDNSEVEDFSVAISKYSNGALSTLTSSLVHHGEEQKFIFQCEKAKISAPFHVVASKSQGNGFGEEDAEVKKEIVDYYNNLPSLEYEGHKAQILDVLEAICYNKDYLVKAEDGKKTLSFIMALYKAGFTEKKVQMPISKEDPYYTVEGINSSVQHFHEKKVSIENFGNEGITLGNDYRKYIYK